MKLMLVAVALLLLAPPALAAAPAVPAPPAVETICVASGFNALVCSITTALCLLQPSAQVCAALQ